MTEEVNFVKYRSIEQAYQQIFIRKVREELGPNQRYVVEEKIHGANFSFWVTGDILQVAKRTGFITPGEEFYNYELVMDKYGEAVRQLAQDIRSTDDTVKTVVVFGELFGGTYPHPDVDPNRSVKRVAKGVYYTPEREFVVFDLKFVHRDGTSLYLSVVDRNKWARKHNLPTPVELMEGTLDECLAIDLDRTTKMPERYGLPSIEGNIIEGVVIRPVQEQYLNGGQRVMLKKKNKQFGEVRPVKKHTPRREKTGEEEMLLEELKRYVTSQRYEGLLSKHGSISNQDKLAGLYVQDVLEDYQKDGGKLDQLSKEEQKAVKRSLASHVKELMGREGWVTLHEM